MMTMIRRIHSVSWILICALWLIPPPAASAQELSAKELKKMLRRADKAANAGRIEEAVGLYGQALDSLPEGDRRRAAALYYTAMSTLSSDTGDEEAAVAKGRLEELATAFPRYERSLEVAVARALIADLDATRDEAERRRAELEEQTAAAQEKPQAAEPESSDQADSQRIKSLEAQLRKVRGQLAETRAELEKKEEALQKLKDALVGRAGGSG